MGPTIHSSSESHKPIAQDGHVKLFGFLPSIQVISAHLPHRIDVLMGSSKVVSILNIGLPASRISIADGSHSLEIWDFAPLSPMFIPTINRITPPIERGAERAMENGEPPLRVSPEPIAMHSHAEIMVFN